MECWTHVPNNLDILLLSFFVYKSGKEIEDKKK